jgi:hypothetical protein
MRGTNVCCSYTSPLRREPVFGQRRNNSGQSVSIVCGKNAGDVFEEEPFGTSSASNLADVINKPPFVLNTFTFPSHRNRLTREPCGYQVHMWRVGDLRQIPKIRDVRMMVGHHLTGCLVNLGIPGELNIYTSQSETHLKATITSA